MSSPLVTSQRFGQYYQSFSKIGAEGLLGLIISMVINEQLETILCSTLKDMEDVGRFNGRDIATTALGMAKIMKQVGHVSGEKPPTGSPHQVLHDLLVEVNSEHKQFIFSEIAISSIPVLPNFDARSLSNLMYAYGHAECVS